MYLDSLQNNANLKYIKLNGTDLEGFQTDTRTYTIELEDTLTGLPEITAEPLSGKSAVSIQLPDDLPGNAIITVKAINGFTLSYTLKFSVVSGIEARAQPAFDFDVLNNPFGDELHIKALHFIHSEPLTITLYSITGQRVLIKKLESALEKEIISIPTNQIPTGVYICCLMQGNNASQQKVLKE